MTIEIFERATGEVVETKEDIKNLRGFLVYWEMQCDDDTYGWRIVDEDGD